MGEGDGCRRPSRNLKWRRSKAGRGSEENGRWSRHMRLAKEGARCQEMDRKMGDSKAGRSKPMI